MNNEKTNNVRLRFLNFSKIEVPKFTVNKQKDYIEYGPNNTFPDELLNLYDTSSLHRAIIKKKISLDCGKGVKSVDDDKKTEEFLKKINIETLMTQIMTDLEIFDGVYLQIQWGLDGKYITDIKHVPFNRMRVGKMDDDNIINEYFYSEQWKKQTKQDDIDIYPKFSIDENKNAVQILTIFKYNPTSLYYPNAGYTGALTDCNTYSSIATYHNSNIKQSFNPSSIITIRGDYTDEQIDDYVRDFTAKYKGAENTGVPIFAFYEEGETPISYETVTPTDIHNQFNALQESTVNNIIMAHEIPHQLVSIPVAGSLGNSKEIQDAEQLFFRSYVEPQQKFILDNLNKLLAINKMSEIKIVNSHPNLLMYSENLLTTILSVDELRGQFGLEPIVKEQPITNTLTEE